MKRLRSQFNTVLYIQFIGFALLLLVSWLERSVFLFSDDTIFSWFHPGTWHEAILESVLIIIVGFVVSIYSRKVLKRLHYLESFLRVCSWCRRLNLDGKWVSMEEYLKDAGGIDCSHGICEDCSEKMILNAAKGIGDISSSAVKKVD